MTAESSLRVPLLLLVTALLAGCISLFPESEPAQLYRFGDVAAPIGEVRSAEREFTVFLAQAEFNRAAAGDRILTVTGTQAAYIKGARWVTSAQDLFNTALRQTFDNSRGPARLVGSGDSATSDYLMKVQVHAFEARYRQGSDSAPEILVSLQVTLTDASDSALVAEHNFSRAVTSADNRVGDIVEAFDQAVTGTLDELVAWVNTRIEHADPQTP